MLPALFQKSIDRESVRALREEIGRRVVEKRHRPPEFRRVVAASVLLAALPPVATLVAAQYYPPLSTDDAAAWEAAIGRMSVEDIRVGSQTIQVPVPSGFLNPKDVILGIRRMMGSPSMPGMIEIFVPIDFMLRALRDDHAALSVYMIIRLEPGAENDLLDLAAFEAIRARAKPPRPYVERWFTLPSRAEDAPSRFVSQTLVRSLDAARYVPGERGTRGTRVCTISVVLVQGKPLEMSLCRPMESERDIQWTQRVSAQWIHAAMRRNAAVPIDSRGVGVFIDVDSSITAVDSSKTTKTGMHVAEVVPGSPAARSGLRRGDYIIGTSGKLLGGMFEPWEAFVRLPHGGSIALTIRREGVERVLVLRKP
jgi:hypothetical protein